MLDVAGGVAIIKVGGANEVEVKTFGCGDFYGLQLDASFY